MKQLLSINLLVLLFIGIEVSGQTLMVPPYLQPGNAPTLTKESKVIIWQTDSVPGKYHVEFSSTAAGAKKATGKVSFVTLRLKNKTTLLYRSTLTGLKFDTEKTGDQVCGLWRLWCRSTPTGRNSLPGIPAKTSIRIGNG